MALRQLGTIDWFVNCHVNKGDDIYIYLGHKEKAIKFKCEAVSGIKEESTIDDAYFGGCPAGKPRRCIEIKYVFEFPDPGIQYKELLECGLNGSIQRPMKIYRSLSKQFGEDYQQAFEYEKAEIVRLLQAGETEDWDTIRDSSIQQQFRFKLLSVYFPDKYFPVCTAAAAKAYCDAVSVPISMSDTMADFTRNLVLWKKSHLPDDWTLYQAMAFTDWLRRNERCSYKTTCQPGSFQRTVALPL